MKTKNIYIALIAVFLLIAVVAGCVCIHQSRDAKTSADAFNELEDLIAMPTETTDAATPTVDATAPSEPEATIDPELAEAQAAYEKYKALYEQNNDFIGWISIEDTNISYPVMQSVDEPDFYLKHGFDKSYSDYGVPYLDEACATGLSNNLVIYGHNMKNGSMFYSLLNYREQSYYDAHPVMYLNTPSQNYKIEVFSGYICNYDSDTYALSFPSEDDYVAYQQKMKSQSDFSCNVELAPTDRVITLSTCTYEYDNARYVVQGKLVPLDG